MTDWMLVKRARQGDDAAFEELVRPYLNLAFRTAWIVTRNAGDAEDATQTALIKAHAALNRFRPDAAMRPWLLQIVANEARNLVRGRERRRSDPLPEPLELAASDRASNPELMAESTERRAWLLHHLKQLPPQDQLVIHCRYILELSVEESAAVIGCARGTVKSRLSRALDRLRRQMESDPHIQEEHP